MKFTKEIQIGLVAIVGIVVLYFGLQFLRGLTMFSSDSRYYVKFDNISGLSASSPVYANGFRVGVVEDIFYDYNHYDEIVASVSLTKEMRLPKGVKPWRTACAWRYHSGWYSGRHDGLSRPNVAADTGHAAKARLHPGQRQPAAG